MMRFLMIMETHSESTQLCGSLCWSFCVGSRLWCWASMWFYLCQL